MAAQGPTRWTGLGSDCDEEGLVGGLLPGWWQVRGTPRGGARRGLLQRGPQEEQRAGSQEASAGRQGHLDRAGTFPGGRQPALATAASSGLPPGLPTGQAPRRLRSRSPVCTYSQQLEQEAGRGGLQTGPGAIPKSPLSAVSWVWAWRPRGQGGALAALHGREWLLLPAVQPPCRGWGGTQASHPWGSTPPRSYSPSPEGSLFLSDPPALASWVPGLQATLRLFWELPKGSLLQGIMNKFLSPSLSFIICKMGDWTKQPQGSS